MDRRTCPHCGAVVPFGSAFVQARQLSVLRWCAQGLTVRGIALRAGIRPATIRHHLDVVHVAAEVSSTTHAVAMFWPWLRITPLPSPSLAKRDREVIRMLAEGSTGWQVALRYGVRHQSIKNRLTSVYRRNGLLNIVHAVALLWPSLGLARPTRCPFHQQADAQIVAAA